MKQTIYPSLLILLFLALSQQKEEEIENTEIQSKNSTYYYVPFHTMKLEGNSTFMINYVDVYIGSPPQKQALIVDTGSTLTAFPCKRCGNQCGNHIDYPYDPSKSKTSTPIPCTHDTKLLPYNCKTCGNVWDPQSCNFQVSYSEGSSLYGSIYQDYMLLGDEVYAFYKDKESMHEKQFLKYYNHQKVSAYFGCTEKETNMFKTQKPDGIMGLGHNTNTTQAYSNIVDEIFKQHKQNHEQHVFSLCIAPLNGGYMSIGGYNHKLHKKGAKTHIVNYQKNSRQYAITLHSIKIAGKNIGLSPDVLGKPFVDSGASVLFAPQIVVQKLQENILSQCDQLQKKNKNACGQNKLKKFGRNICFKYNKSQFPNKFDFLNSFPTIEFELDDHFMYKWTGKDYLMIDPINDPKGNYLCQAFESYAGNIIFGNSWMRSHDILFDRDNYQMHFTESNCERHDIYDSYIEDNYGNIMETDSDRDFYLKQHAIDNKVHDKYENTPNSDITDPGLQNSNNNINKNDDKNGLNPNKSSKFDAIHIILFIFLLFMVILVYFIFCKKRNNYIDIQEEKNLSKNQQQNDIENLGQDNPNLNTDTQEIYQFQLEDQQNYQQFKQQQHLQSQQGVNDSNMTNESEFHVNKQSVFS